MNSENLAVLYPSQQTCASTLGGIAAWMVLASSAAGAGAADAFVAGATRLEMVERMLPRDLRDAGSEDTRAATGAAPPAFRLQQIGLRMRVAESALQAADVSGRASSTQQEVLEELDVLLWRVQQQCDQCAGGGQQQSLAKRKPTAAARKPGAKPGEAAATTATVATAKPVDRQAIGRLVNDVWGKLPQRQRDELLQPLAEEFLPQYADEIAAYFESLAERPEAGEATEAPW